MGDLVAAGPALRQQQGAHAGEPHRTDTLDRGDREGVIAAYAFARTGYHRGLDALRRAGWRGKGPIPWAHEPNQGFLRSLWALAGAAWRIGEQAEYDRCVGFLVEASEEGYVELVRSRPLSL